MALKFEKTDKCEFLGLFSDILNLIDFNGLFCFNFKIVDDVPMIFEINPRLGWSLCNHFYSSMKYLN